MNHGRAVTLAEMKAWAQTLAEMREWVRQLEQPGLVDGFVQVDQLTDSMYDLLRNATADVIRQGLSLFHEGYWLSGPERFLPISNLRPRRVTPTELVDLFLEAGTDPNADIGGAERSDAQTFLGDVARMGDMRGVRQLLRAGADPMANVAEAFRYALEQENYRIQALLLRAGLDPRLVTPRHMWDLGFWSYFSLPVNLRDSLPASGPGARRQASRADAALAAALPTNLVRHLREAL